ncbi:TPA: ShlB/FhaC/HecB family hemolysin secretion/activation protein [Burkholderia vietnamiensis]|nr:ShlB/FhaC/HecB family hemolysin secretion/activation protein [Burkholderia vietnamiensis]HDR8920592.1 ShlB/FhaC/HecB family hemolysin secretion/activation protein [Burkholderia vietnamiensis]HDR8979271.1 ShlB/FhaC/HecB family hemolysin secretion/activation protein [Burkholderia vietnamiensis]HDR9005620.1 ShlB/FhaC/HecB family hemolysin secretion/activation protein [Burkholderia vietnamiensis]HDR9065857.1 ShlB/FhaC/HecB family hemolysin secretion/activation protein [Burkholderia vietnamiensis
MAGGLCGAPGVRAQQAAAPQAPAPQTFDVNAFVVRGNTTLPALEIEKAVYPFEGPGRTLADVNGARDALQKVYQDRGYQSVVVELPQQQVKNGVILLQVTEAKVGRLRVEGARYDSPQNIRDAVPALAEGKVPDFNQAQQQLTGLNRSADRQVIPVLKPGTMPQTVDVDLKVDDHSPLHGTLELNNDNSPGTSALRTSASLSYSNLWQLGHVISGTYVIAPQHPNDARVYAFSYLAPIKDTRWSFLATVVHSDSNVASVGGTNVLGKGTTYGFTAIYALPGSDTYAHTVSIEIDRKHYDENVSVVGQTSTAPLTYVPVTFSYSGQLSLTNSQTSFSASLTTNIRGLGSDWGAWDNKRYNATPDFVYGKFDVNHTQRFANDMQANAHVSAQLSNSPLVSSEQFAAGGMNSVRGYMQAEDTADSGVIASLELRSPSLSKWLGGAVGSRVNEWRFHAFFDAAHLWLLSPLPEQTSRFNLMSVGVGTRLQLMKYASADFEAGWPLKAGVYTRQYSPRFDFYVRLGF